MRPRNRPVVAPFGLRGTAQSCECERSSLGVFSGQPAPGASIGASCRREVAALEPKRAPQREQRRLQRIHWQLGEVHPRIAAEHRVGGAEIEQRSRGLGAHGGDDTRRDALAVGEAPEEKSVVARDDDRGGPLLRLDAEPVELGREPVGLLRRQGDVGIDAVDERLDDGATAGMVGGEFFPEVPAKAELPRRDVHLDATRADEFAHRAGGAAPPRLKLPESVARNAPALREEEVVLVCRRDVHDAGGVALERYRGLEAGRPQALRLGRHAGGEREGDERDERDDRDERGTEQEWTHEVRR